MSLCRNCHGSIKFVRLDTGKAIPVDPQPNPRGNVAAQLMGRHKWFGYVLSASKPLRDGYALHMPHHAHCNPDEKPRVLASDRTPSLFDPTTS